MKKIQLLSILVLSGAVLFGGKATANKAKVNFKESDLARSESVSVGSVADLMINSDKAIHGLQFDIKYNPAEIKSITLSEIPDFWVKYNENPLKCRRNRTFCQSLPLCFYRISNEIAFLKF